MPESCCHRRPAIAERRKRARGSTELEHGRVGERRFEALRRAIKRVAPAGGFQPKGDGRGLLQPGAADHHGFHVALRMTCGRIGGTEEVSDQRGNSRAELEDESGIDDVLASGSPVNVTRGIRIAC